MSYDEFGHEYGFRSRHHTDCSIFQYWMDRAHQTGGIDEVTVVQVESLNLHQDTAYTPRLRTAHRHVLNRWTDVQRDLVARQHDLEDAFDVDMLNHVADNTYVNGLRLENIYPDLRDYMHEHYNPAEPEFVSMFGLNKLNLQEHAREEIQYDILLDDEFIEGRTREYLSQADRYLAEAEENVQLARSELNSIFENWQEFTDEQEGLIDGANTQLSAKLVTKSAEASEQTYYYGTIAGFALASGLLASLAFARKKVAGKKTEEDFEALL